MSQGWPTKPDEPYFGRGVWGWDGTQWRKLPLLWGYTDRLAEDLGGTKSGDGTYIGWSEAVGAGEVWRVEAIMGQNNTTAPSFVALYVHDGTSVWAVGFTSGPGLGVPVIALGPFTLKQGDKVRIDVGGCLDDDEVVGVAWGYKMAVT